MKSKRERFENIASKRIQKVLDTLESLSKCANKNNYEYYDKDIHKMIMAIKNKVKFVEDTFKQRLNNKKNTFKF